jgi:3-methyladenine DNA glycosylase Tag
LNSWNVQQLRDAPSQTAKSQAMSKALKKIGFQFVGPTTFYAMMQSVGIVIDHPVTLQSGRLRTNDFSPDPVAIKNDDL